MRFSSGLLLLLLVAGCMQPPIVRSTSPQGISEVEIRDYQGERLGSVGDFRENSIKGPQNVNISGYQLLVDGLVQTPKIYTYDELLAKPSYSKVITLNCVEGWSVKVLWTGIRINDLLADTGVRPEANTAKFYAVDGYTTTLPLEYIRSNNIMLAFKMNNITLPPENGFPFQLVAESKWGYKWIRWVNHIELTDKPEEKGFWEQQGYSQTGDLDKPMFDR